MDSASEEDINRFMEIAGTDYSQRSPDDHAFMQSFAGDWLQGLSDRRAMDSNLWQAHTAWKFERDSYGEYDVVPTPPREAEALPDPIEWGDIAEAPRRERGMEPGAHSASTSAGSMIEAAERSGRGTDNMYIEFLDSGSEGARWNDRLGCLAKGAVIGSTILAGGLGLRAGCGAKNAAENVGRKVEKLHHDTKMFVDDVARDPNHARVPTIEQGRAR